MAYKLSWSPVSRDDLREIVRFISQDSPQRAASFALRLMERADVLQQHPEIGHPVPENRSPLVRELLVRPYRIVYRLDHAEQKVEIVRVWHAARGALEME